ncbi:hypothetical protein [Streptomyces botrytidirepellens]|nr:hypothetical protein [Streptomyces botrytidirepellens]
MLPDRAADIEIPIDVLDQYQLQTWEPFELLLPTAGALGNVRPRDLPS